MALFLRRGKKKEKDVTPVPLQRKTNVSPHDLRNLRSYQQFCEEGKGAAASKSREGGEEGSRICLLLGEKWESSESVF